MVAIKGKLKKGDVNLDDEIGAFVSEHFLQRCLVADQSISIHNYPDPNLYLTPYRI